MGVSLVVVDLLGSPLHTLLSPWLSEDISWSHDQAGSQGRLARADSGHYITRRLWEFPKLNPKQQVPQM